MRELRGLRGLTRDISAVENFGLANFSRTKFSNNVSFQKIVKVVTTCFLMHEDHVMSPDVLAEAAAFSRMS